MTTQSFKVRSIRTFNSQERGVALAMALIMLAILTILGISAMKTSMLEVRMSGNVWDSTATFQDAESGLASNAAVLDITNSTPATTTTSARGATVTVSNTFRGFGAPPRGWGYSAVNYQVANFTQRAEAKTPSGAKTTVNQGMYQVVNKSN